MRPRVNDSADVAILADFEAPVLRMPDTLSVEMSLPTFKLKTKDQTYFRMSA